MSDEQVITCPDCGKTYETSIFLDGTFNFNGQINFDGTVNLKGVKCPHCLSTATSKE